MSEEERNQHVIEATSLWKLSWQWNRFLIPLAVGNQRAISTAPTEFDAGFPPGDRELQLEEVANDK